MRLPVIVLGLVVSHHALADREQLAEQMAAMAADLPKVVADPGRDTAPVRSPPWCAAIQVKPGNNPRFIARSIEDAQKNGWTSLLEAARKTCAYPGEPAVHQAAAVIEQEWINLTGQADADAAASIAARLDTAGWDAARKQLCDGLQVGNEVTGEDEVFMRARRDVLGCSNEGPLWASNDSPPRELAAYLDQSATEPDAIVRLARVVDRAKGGFESQRSNFDRRVAAYAVDRYDFQALTAAQVNAALDAEPYRGNLYARIVAKESFARAQLGIAALDAEVATRIKDADWKELLIDAPRRGLDAYVAEIKPYAGEIARSNAAEHVLFGASKKAMAGCLPVLRKDFLAAWKRAPIHSEVDALEALSKPVTSLLFHRLVTCMAIESDPMVAAQLVAVLKHVRYERGPRTAVYDAAFDALTKITADRPRFPVGPNDLPMPVDNQLAGLARSLLDGRKQHDEMGFALSEHGSVKSATRTAAGLVIVFDDKQRKEMGRICTNTNHILLIESNGTIVYSQICKDTGMITVHDQPESLTVPLELADGIKPGTVLEFAVTRGHTPTARIGFPRAAYADGTKTRLVNFRGFGL